MTLGIERMAVIGWSGYGMEMAVYAIRHPDRVTRLVQVAPVPPAARIFREAGGDRRAARMDTAALAALDRRLRAGEFANDGGGYCRARNRLTLPTNVADATPGRVVPPITARQEFLDCDHRARDHSGAGGAGPEQGWPVCGDPRFRGGVALPQPLPDWSGARSLLAGPSHPRTGHWYDAPGI